jgi:predicted DCC family thiol-disulfide oxidoreductase YuxK
VGIYLTQRAPFFHFIVLYIVFLDPIRAEWRRLRGRLRGRGAGLETRAAPVAPGPTAAASRWTVLYDGLCPLCIRTATIVDLLDGGRRVALVDFEGSWARASALAQGLTREQAREAMHLVAPDGRRVRGFLAFRALTGVVPALWPLAPLLRLPGVAPAGDLIYRFVAARRPRRHCRADTCTI